MIEVISLNMLRSVRLKSIASEAAPDQQPHDQTLVMAPSVAAPSPRAAKQAIRRSLTASTLDGVFATIFSNITGGVLLSNFLVELHASPSQIGLLSSIPMLANLVQPLGAFWGDRTTSRHNYCLWVYGPSRVLWLVLAAGIALVNWRHLDSQVLVMWTLAIVCLTHFIGALGSASWLSWLAALVPRRLRGRYFGIRNSAASLTNLLCAPLLGLAVSTFPGGSLRGFGVLLVLGVVAGLISLGFQFLMVDVNPQMQGEEGDTEQENETEAAEIAEEPPHSSPSIPPPTQSFLQDKNFLFFL